MGDRVALKSTFQKKSEEETKKRNTDVVFLYDASRSVSDMDFQMSLHAGVSFVNTFSTNTMVAVCQFSNGCKIESNLTFDKSLIQRSHFGMKKVGGGTDTTSALQTAHRILSSGRGDAIKVVYLFTDGAPNDQNSAVQAASILRSSGIQIIGVGIGNVSKKQLEQVCGAGSTFVINDYDALLSAVPSISSGSSTVPNSEIHFAFIQKRKPVGFKEPLPLEIKIKNVGSVDIPENSLLVITAGEFYEKEVKRIQHIPIETSRTVAIELQPTGNAEIKTLPEEIQVQILHPTSKLPFFSKHSGFQIILANLVGDIVSWRPKNSQLFPKANILVFGPAGVGKSTLINSIFSLWYDSFTATAPAWDSDDHVTIANELYQDHQGFAFLDTVGLSDSNYLSSEFNMIINGALPVGFKVNDDDPSSFVMQNLHTAQERQIHACIFVVTQGFRGYIRTQPEKVGRLRSFIESAVRKGLSPILAVTRLDEVPETERDKLRTEFRSISGLAERDIFLVDNSSSDEKQLHQERIAYQVLRRVLDNSDEFIKRYLQKNPALSQQLQRQAAASQAQQNSPEPQQRSFQQNSPQAMTQRQPQPQAQRPQPSPSQVPEKSSGLNQIPAQTTSSTFDNIEIIDWTSRTSLGDLYGEYDLDGTTLGNLRLEISDQLSEFNFEFINPKTSNPVPQRQEDKIKMKTVVQSGNQVPQIFIKKSSPPPY